MFLYHLRPAGQGLVQLFFSSLVQSFFNGVAPKELYPEKGLYQPGRMCNFIKQHYIHAQPTITVSLGKQFTAFNANYSFRLENRVCKQPPFHWKMVQNHWKTFQAHDSTSACQATTAGQGPSIWCLRSSNW